MPRFGAILFLPPRLQAEADRGNDAKVWSCLSRRRGPADRRLALLEGRSDERGHIGGVARDGQKVLADREGGVRRVGQALPAGLHLEMRPVPVRVSSLLAG